MSTYMCICVSTSACPLHRRSHEYGFYTDCHLYTQCHTQPHTSLCTCPMAAVDVRALTLSSRTRAAALERAIADRDAEIRRLKGVQRGGDGAKMSEQANMICQELGPCGVSTTRGDPHRGLPPPTSTARDLVASVSELQVSVWFVCVGVCEHAELWRAMPSV